MSVAYVHEMIGGRWDGVKMPANRPYIQCQTSDGHLYQAELDDEGLPVVNEFAGDYPGLVVVHSDGDSERSPILHRVNMRYAGKVQRGK